MLVGNFGGLTPASLLVCQPNRTQKRRSLLTIQLIIWILTTIALVFVVLRTVIHFLVHRRVSIDIICVWIALAFLIAIAGIYTKITPTLFEVDRVTSGAERISPAVLDRANLFLRCQFALILLFWTAVWAVKFSILMFYKDLFYRLPRQNRYWWIVFGYVALSYLACWGTQLASCWPIPTYFSFGGRLERRVEFSMGSRR